VKNSSTKVLHPQWNQAIFTSIQEAHFHLGVPAMGTPVPSVPHWQAILKLQWSSPCDLAQRTMFS
jgi:hypothetical protein